MFERYMQRKLPDARDAAARSRMGREASLIGIGTNLALAASKIVVGTLSGAISMVADGLNNSMDLLSSLISLGGFHFAAMPADRRHPYGHARMEYLASFVVSLIILWTGASLFWESGKSILHPKAMEVLPVAFVVLLLSVGAKFLLFAYNLALGKRMGSDLLIATAYDARGDVLATSTVVLSVGVQKLFGLNIDGFVGLLVAGVILKSGWESLTDTVDSLLGEKTDPALIEELLAFIESFPVAIGVHDLIYHDYGAQKRFLTVHVEVNSEWDVLKIHEDIDEIERRLAEEFQLDATIHIDPIRIDDPRSNALYDYLKGTLREIHPKLDLHDFRIVDRKDGLNLVFDVLVPMAMEGKEEEIDRRLRQKVAEKHPEYALITTYDPDYQDLLGAQE